MEVLFFQMEILFFRRQIEYFNYYKYTKKGLKMKNTIKLALLSVVTACVFLLALQSQKQCNITKIQKMLQN